MYRIEYSHKKKDFKDVWNMERKYFKASTIASIKQTMSWDEKNNDIHIFIRNLELDKIIAEITMLPLSKKQFDRFIKNNLLDSEINEANLLKYENNNSYYLLFSAIAIDPCYRKDRLVLYLLLKGFYEKIKDLMGRNIIFLNMCAEGQTKEGQRFIENFLDLKVKNKSKEGYKLYCFENEKEFNKWLSIFPMYIEKYKEKFNI